MSMNDFEMFWDILSPSSRRLLVSRSRLRLSVLDLSLPLLLYRRKQLVYNINT